MSFTDDRLGQNRSMEIFGGLVERIGWERGGFKLGQGQWGWKRKGF